MKLSLSLAVWFVLVCIFPLHIFAKDCNDLQNGCQRCEGNGFVVCYMGKLQSVVSCGANRTCQPTSNGCYVKCTLNDGSHINDISLQQHDDPGAKPCVQGKVKVKHHCKFCVNGSLMLKCMNGNFEDPKTCSHGQKCKQFPNALGNECDARCV